MKLDLQKGTIDMAFRDFTPTEYAALNHTSGITEHKGAGVNIRYLVLNVKRAPTNNLAVRKAIAYLMPRQAIATRVWHGFVQPLYSQVPAGLPGHIDAFATAFHPEARTTVGIADQIAEHIIELAHRKRVGIFELDRLVLPSRDQLRVQQHMVARGKMHVPLVARHVEVGLEVELRDAEGVLVGWHGHGIALGPVRRQRQQAQGVARGQQQRQGGGEGGATCRVRRGHGGPRCHGSPVPRSLNQCECVLLTSQGCLGIPPE